MNIKNIIQSKRTRGLIIGIGLVIIVLIIFQAGIFVGYKKASFSYRWGENYHNNFAGPREGFFGNFRRGFGDKDFINANGTFGSIIKNDGSMDSTSSPQASSGQVTLVIKGKDDVEKTVLVSDKTKIINRRETIRASDLKVDDYVVVIGSPNEQGQIEAKLIRLMPMPPIESK